MPLAAIPPDAARFLINHDSECEIGRDIIMQWVKGGPNIKDATARVIDPKRYAQASPKNVMLSYCIGIRDTRAMPTGKR